MKKTQPICILVFSLIILIFLLFSRSVVSNSLKPHGLYSLPGFPVHHLLEFAQAQVHLLSDASNYLILCHPLLLLPSIFPSIRVFSNEATRHIRWSKYWSFSISLSNEYSGLISFRSDWFDLLAIQGTFKSLSLAPQFKSINSSALSLLYSPTLLLQSKCYPWGF